jgi:hypothetical protein
MNCQPRGRLSSGGFGLVLSGSGTISVTQIEHITDTASGETFFSIRPHCLHAIFLRGKPASLLEASISFFVIRFLLS